MATQDSTRADAGTEAQATVPPLVLVIGDEELLVARALENIARTVSRSDPDADIRDFAAGEVEAAELFELLSPSLFGGRRVVMLRGAQDLKVATLSALTPMLLAPEPDVTIVLAHAGGAKGKAVLEAAKKGGATVITCAKLTKPSERSDFVRSEVRSLGAKISADAAQLLIDAVGSDLRDLAAAVSQLVSDAGKQIDIEAVRRYYRGRAEVKGFEISDKAVSGDRAGALEAFRWALADGVPVVIVADALAQGVDAVARVAAMGGGNQYDIAARVGMPPWKVGRVQSQARGWGEAGLRAALGVVATLNADVKGEAADANYAVERAISRITDLREPARR